MNEHWNSIYTPHFESDNNFCKPLLAGGEISSILTCTGMIAEKMVGAGPKPKVALDLEQIQVANYGDFAPITQQQQEAIRRLHAVHPVRPDEMAFLALRSLINLNWNKPQNEDDIRRAAAYDKALEIVLTKFSGDLASSLTHTDAPLPYWGRLAFLRVMAMIPDEQIKAQKLDQITCILLKDPRFNARSFRYAEFSLIGLNFALEPILKGLNRMLVHFFYGQEWAGPQRMERAWASMVPVIAYFWAKKPVAVNLLSPMHVLFEEQAVLDAHAMTANQVSFIIRHELGHLALDHGRRLREVEVDPNKAALPLRHEFEFAADAFAQGALRSTLYSRMRSNLQWNQELPDTAAAADLKTLNALKEHQAEVSQVRILFVYMEAINQLGLLFKRRLGESIEFRSQVDSHPSARERRSRLDAFHAGEHAPTSILLRYAENFFAEIQEYADSLDDATLAESLKNLY